MRASKRTGPVVAKGNVPTRLRVKDAGEAQAKAVLARAITSIIAERQLTQVQAARLLGIDQPKVSALIHGRVNGFSLERLLRLLLALDRDVELIVKPRAPSHARLTVITDQRPTLADLRARRQEILRIAGAHGAHNVRVFGSIARDEARPDSDVDFLVEFEPGRTVLDLGELIFDLKEALGREVDVVQSRHALSAAERIRREAVPL